jgi:hypothetical protein
MGLSLSWVAVKKCTPQSVHEALGLRATGERMELPEAELTGATLPCGWYAVFSDHDRFGLTSESKLARLSAQGEVLLCFVEEHCMNSLAQCWRKGSEVWSILHDAQRGLDHLEADGDLPAAFAGIRDELWSKLKSDDHPCDYLFSVPVDVAYSVTGYCPYRDIPGMGSDAFEVLEPTSARRDPAAPASWWRRLFRR